MKDLVAKHSLHDDDAREGLAIDRSFANLLSRETWQAAIVPALACIVSCRGASQAASIQNAFPARNLTRSPVKQGPMSNLLSQYYLASLYALCAAR
jgi:hypothetical protein